MTDLDLTSLAATFRAGGYHYTGYLGTPPQTVVFSRAVNQASFSEQLTAITFDDAYTGAGAYTDVREDMTVLVYDGNSARLKGRLRVAAGAASSTVLQVNEISTGALTLADNDRFDVVEEWRIWDKLVSATADFLKDSRIAFVAQTADYRPIANGGGLIAVMLPRDATELTADFDWTSSLAVDPDNTSGLGYSVDVKDGTITVGTTTTSACTATFPPGYRTVELTVTDLDNGATTLLQIPVDVYHPTLRPALACEIDSLRYDEQQLGWACDGLRLPRASESALAALPDGAPVWYFEDEVYSGVHVSYGSDAPAAGRDQVKFVGYLVRDTLTITPDGDEVVFEALGPLGVLERTAALPQLLIRDDAPANWQEGKGLTVRLFLWYLWAWHASVGAVFDLLWIDGYDLADEPYPRLATENTANLAEQIREIARAIRCELTCDRLGRLRIIRDPNFLTVAERAARTIEYHLTTADLTELEESHEHGRQIKLVVYEALTTGATTSAQSAVYSLAPGPAPGEGTAVETVTGELVSNQTMANQAAGDHYARLNGLYYDESTKQLRPVPKGARWGLPDGYDWHDPAAMRFVTLTLAASTNRRGVSYSTATRWLVRSVQIGTGLVSTDAGEESRGKDVVWTVDHETHGKEGTTDSRPQSSQNGLPNTPGLDITIPGIGDWVPPTTPYLTAGRQSVGFVSTGGYLMYCGPALTGVGFDVPASAGGPRWLGALLGVTGNPTDFVQSSIQQSRLIVTTDDADGIWTVDNVGPTPTVTLRKTLGAAVSSTGRWRIVEAPIGTDFVVVISHYDQTGPQGTWWTYSLDGGDTWSTETQINANSETGTLLSAGGLHVSTHLIGTALTSAFSVSGLLTGAQGSIYRLSSNFSAVAQITTPALFNPKDSLAFCIHVPLHDNPSDSLIYFGAVDFSLSANDRSYFLRKNKDGSVSDITPTVNGRKMRPAFNRSIHTCHVNRQYLAATLTGGGDTNVVMVSRDAGDTLTQITPGTTTEYTFIEVAGDNPLVLYAGGNNGAVGSSSDFGTTGLDDRSGNIPTDYPLVGRVLRLFGL